MIKQIILFSSTLTLFAAPLAGCDDDDHGHDHAHDDGHAHAQGSDHAHHESPPADEQNDVDQPQRVEVSVDARGYQPAQVPARAGQALTMVFTRTTDEGCGQKLSIPAHDIERDLPLNEPVEVTFTPHETGELRFTCGMDMYDGKVVVTQ